MHIETKTCLLRYISNIITNALQTHTISRKNRRYIKNECHGEEGTEI